MMMMIRSTNKTYSTAAHRLCSTRAIAVSRYCTKNIAYQAKSNNQSDIERAAKAAHAHEFVMSLPDGYDTVVGERGVKLSGGQKQRIVIARAILKSADNVI